MGALIGDLTYWLSYRKFTTDRYMPAPSWLPKLYHKRPYWYEFDFSLASQQTLRMRQAARNTGWLVSIAGKSSLPAGFQCRVLDVRRSRWWSRIFVAQSNFCGSGSQRFHLRHPQYYRQGDTIIIEVKNVATAALTGTITLEAVLNVSQSA